MSGRGSSADRGLAFKRPPCKAANLCVDRNAMKDGWWLPMAATGTFEPGHPWRGNPKF